MLTILIILAVTVLLLILAGLILNLSLYKRNGPHGAQQNRRKSYTAQLHERIFQREKNTSPLDRNDY
jgi:hypothetical protein